MSVYQDKKFRRISGKEKDNLVREVCSYFLGNQSKHIEGKTIAELITITGKKSRDTIYSYLDRGIELGIAGLSKDEKTGRYSRLEIVKKENFETFCKNNPITNHPLIKEWIDKKLNYGGFSKTGVANKLTLISSVGKICNHFKITPLQLIQEKAITADYLEKYRDGLRNGEIPISKKRKDSDYQYAFYRMVMGVRSFVTYHNISLAKGEGGVWNASVIGHGNHPDVRLTPQQFIQVEDYLIKNFGVDSDFYRLFWVGVESCSRHTALLNMELNWTVDEDLTNPTFFLSAFEGKTKHIKGGKQTKHITRSKTQDSLQYLKDRNSSNLLWEAKISKVKMGIVFSDNLKKMYKEIGCTDEYFFNHPVHSLRHIGAHYWLDASDYDYEFVSDVGGWTTSAELKTSYGEIPPEVFARKLKRFRKNMVNVGMSL